jgi:ABC-2 type transport system ATP-binding protein
MLEIFKINKKFGNKLVLNNVSLNIPIGSICGLLGLNGAGKSTLMKIITSLMFKDSGEIKYNGEIYEKDESSISIGYMIESPSFYKDLSGKDNLLLLASLYNSINKYRVEEVLIKVGLQESKDVLVKKYSLGMKQRLYFAYAILGNPEVLVLDEPFNGIDPVTSKLFKDLIKDLSNKGCTILISSHVINDVKQICDKVVIIDRGIVVYDNSVSKDDDLEQLFISKVSNSGYAQ